MDVVGLLAVLTIKKDVPIYFAKTELFFQFQNQNYSIYVRFIFSIISQILKRKLHGLFRHKHIET